MTTPLRDDYDAAKLRGEARKTKDAGQARRLLALAVRLHESLRLAICRMFDCRELENSATTFS